MRARRRRGASRVGCVTEPLEPDNATPADDEPGEDAIDEASDESFPASDAPQWWSGPQDEPS